MKNKTALLSVSALLAVGLTFTACKNDNNPVTTPTTTRFTATLNGASEKPTSTTSPATGTFVGNLDETSRVMSYTVTYAGFPTSSSVTAGHLHRVIPGDAAGVNGVNPAPEIPFASLTSPIIGTTPTLTQARVDSMKNGFYYANIHTNDYPNGAIRGNVVRQ
ncbi:CHRD domain-containing protein [Fibrella arboris]|uniref:CHRD domain-containing protein n=1 Tax=Fibrella arboris TaxID=3242486 RepID=UPI00351FC7BC